MRVRGRWRESECVKRRITKVNALDFSVRQVHTHTYPFSTHSLQISLPSPSSHPFSFPLPPPHLPVIDHHEFKQRDEGIDEVVKVVAVVV